MTLNEEVSRFWLWCKFPISIVLMLRGSKLATLKTHLPTYNVDFNADGSKWTYQCTRNYLFNLQATLNDDSSGVA